MRVELSLVERFAAHFCFVKHPLFSHSSPIRVPRLTHSPTHSRKRTQTHPEPRRKMLSIRSLLRSALLATTVLVVQVQGQEGPFPVCEVCGEGLRVTALDVMIMIPTQEPLDCATLEMGGLNGMIEAQFCPLIATFVGPCECAPLVVAPTASMDGSIMPSDMPSTMPSEGTTAMMGDMSDLPSDMPSLMPNSSGSPSMTNVGSMDPVAAPTTAPDATVPTGMPIMETPTAAPSGATVTSAATVMLLVPLMAFLV